MVYDMQKEVSCWFFAKTEKKCRFLLECNQHIITLLLREGKKRILSNSYHLLWFSVSQNHPKIIFYIRYVWEREWEEVAKRERRRCGNISYPQRRGMKYKKMRKLNWSKSIINSDYLPLSRQIIDPRESVSTETREPRKDTKFRERDTYSCIDN